MTDRSGDLLAQALQSNETLVDLDVSRNLLRESAGNLIILAKGLHRLNAASDSLSMDSVSRFLPCTRLVRFFIRIGFAPKAVTQMSTCSIF